MSDTIKVLAQIAPTAATLTPAYTATASTTISSAVICNTSSTTDYIRISIQVSGASDTLQQYLYYDLPIQGNDTFIATCGFTLATGDVIAVRSASGNLSFNFFGVVTV
jgi:hypothetical protein